MATGLSAELGKAHKLIMRANILSISTLSHGSQSKVKQNNVDCVGNVPCL